MCVGPGALCLHASDLSHPLPSQVLNLDLDVFYNDIDDEPKAAWLSVLNIERASYLRQFESGMCSMVVYTSIFA